MSYRLMVVGSADWEEDATVHRELSRVHDEVVETGMTITLVTAGVGGHGKGAEAMSIEVAGDLGWEVELHPPDYGIIGQSPYLSAVAEMVDTRPDLCLAFVNDDNSIVGRAGGMVETLDISMVWLREKDWGFSEF